MPIGAALYRWRSAPEPTGGFPRSVRRLPGPFAVVAVPARTSRRVSVPAPRRVLVPFTAQSSRCRRGVSPPHRKHVKGEPPACGPPAPNLNRRGRAIAGIAETPDRRATARKGRTECLGSRRRRADGGTIRTARVQQLLLSSRTILNAGLS